MKKFLLSLSILSYGCLSAEELIPPPPDRSFWHTFTMMALAALLFYFILFRPEQVRRKQLEKQRSAMKKGDRVTAMGIIGTVAKIQDDTVVVRMYDGTKLEFLKAAITDVTPGSDESANEG